MAHLADFLAVAFQEEASMVEEVLLEEEEAQEVFDILGIF